jgi:hypothetical protein
LSKNGKKSTLKKTLLGGWHVTLLQHLATIKVTKTYFDFFSVIGGHDIENVFPPLFGRSFENQNICPFFFIFFPYHLVGICRWLVI